MIEPSSDPIINNNYFRIALALGIIFTCISFTASFLNHSQQQQCADIYIRYCDYFDSDIDLCYHDEEIYCCHREEHGREEGRENCGRYKHCYRIIEETDDDDCNEESASIISHIFYFLAFVCLLAMLWIFRSHHKEKRERRERAQQTNIELQQVRQQERRRRGEVGRQEEERRHQGEGSIL